MRSPLPARTLRPKARTRLPRLVVTIAGVIAAGLAATLGAHASLRYGAEMPADLKATLSAPLPPAPTSGKATEPQAAQRSEVELEVHPTLRLEGRVVDADGRPAAFVDVIAQSDDDPSHPLLRARTDAQGRFRLVDVPPGRLRVSAGLRSGAPTEVTLDVPAGAPSAMRFVLRGHDPASGRERAQRAWAPEPSTEPGSRWCCRRAYTEEGVVFGKACMRVSGPSAAQSCGQYQLANHVLCAGAAEGVFASPDLSRTGRLACEGVQLSMAKPQPIGDGTF